MFGVLDSERTRERGACAGYEGIVGGKGVNTLLLKSAIDARNDQIHASADLSQRKELPAPTE